MKCRKASTEKNKMDIREFVLKYSQDFEQAIEIVDADARASIRSNSGLNKIYDLFLDFILDSKKILK